MVCLHETYSYVFLPFHLLELFFFSRFYIFILNCFISLFSMAWVSFSCCMGAAVLTFNSYTKNIIEIRRRQRLRPEEARAAPSYEEVVSGVGIYSISGLQQCPDGMMDSMWLKPETVGVKAEVDIPMLVLMEGCEPEECEDCEREMDEMEKAMEREETDSPC